MRKVFIPTLAIFSASSTSVVTITIPTSCESFVHAAYAPRRRGEISFSRFLKNVDNVGNSPDDSIDEIEIRISTMKVVELKAELKSHGQSSNGLKRILQQRLLDFYRANSKILPKKRNHSDNQTYDGDGDNIHDKEGYESKVKMRGKVQETNDNDVRMHITRDQHDKSPPVGLLNSKQKWKKKIYLLTEDVRKLVHSNDAMVRQRGPKKAREAVRRIQRWISSCDSTSFFTVEFEDGFNDSYDEVGEDDVARIIDLDSNSMKEFQDYQMSSLLRAYNLWIHAIAKSGSDNAGYVAEQVLKEIQQNVSDGGPSPNEVTIASVMDAHAHSASMSSSKSSAKAAESFLFELLEKHEASNEEHNIPWSNDGVNPLRDSLIVTCDTMLNAWAREGTTESAERAQLIVLRLEEYQRQREIQRKKSRSKRIRESYSVEWEIAIESASKKRPISYATVMNAWANVGSSEAAEHAETTLRSLVQRAKADKKEKRNHDDELLKLVSIEPDTIVFNSVIQCWATSRDIRAGEKSLQLLEQMKELACPSSSENIDDQENKIYFDTQPDIITYNTVLSAWSHCGNEDSAQQAERIVKELVIEKRKNEELGLTSVVANTITFNTVLHAWSKSKLPVATYRAEKLLEYMIQCNAPEMKPDVYSFTCVMDAWAKSKEPYKALRTRKLLDQLIEMREVALKNRDKRKADGLLPTQIPYNTVLNACAFSALKTPQEEQRVAIQIAVDTYKSMSSRQSSAGIKDDGKVVARDAVTYGLMLKCIANLMPKGTVRSRMALRIFQECCTDGLVGFLVWNEVRRAVPCKLIQETHRFKRQCGSLEVVDLPKEWTRNCRERRSNQRRQRNQNIRNKTTKDKYKNDKSGHVSKKQHENPTFIVERSFATGKDI